MAKTIDYKFKSNSWEIVSLPEECVKMTEKLIDDVSKIKSTNDLITLVKEHPYAISNEIMEPLCDFINSKQGSNESLELEDFVYLNISLNVMNYTYKSKRDEMKKAYETQEAMVDSEYKNVVGPILKSMEGLLSKMGKAGKIGRRQ